ncbi:ester cyclase [Ectothiorhodospiraceae bacterium 2226]|nr:ester cyclase [Ectothiorhodospiraceae bacterium 2226]
MAAVLAVVETFTTAFPDLAIEIRHQHLPSQSVSIVEYVFAGTHRGDLEGIPPTGRRMEVVACSVVEVREGRIGWERDYYDTLALMEQLGVAGNRLDGNP